MCPVLHGSCMLMPGLAARTRGTRTRRRTFVVMLLPSMWHTSMGSSQSIGFIMAGGRPWARHASATVARLRLLPIQGGCLRDCSRHEKYGVALRDPPLALESCSSTIQSCPCIARVSFRIATVLTHSAAAGGSRPSTSGQRAVGRTFPLPSTSSRERMSLAWSVQTCGSSAAMSVRTTPRYITWVCYGVCPYPAS